MLTRLLYYSDLAVLESKLPVFSPAAQSKVLSRACGEWSPSTPFSQRVFSSLTVNVLLFAFFFDSRSFQMLHLWIQHHSELSKLLISKKIDLWLPILPDVSQNSTNYVVLQTLREVKESSFLRTSSTNLESNFCWAAAPRGRISCLMTLVSFDEQLLCPDHSFQSWMHHLVSFCCFKWNGRYFS